MNGSVYRRQSGSWEYRFDLGPDPLTGRRRTTGKSGFKTKKEAARALRAAVTAHERGRSVRRNSQTVSSFLSDWHASVRAQLRPSTWVNYRDYLNAYVLPVIGDSRLQDVTPMRLNLLYSHLLERGRVKTKGGLSPKTVQNVHRMLHRAFADAAKWDLMPRNPAEDAQPPRVSRTQPTIWTPDQLGAFVRHVQGDRFFALWLLVATTGLRRGELAGLRRRDIDLVRARISPTVPRVVVAGKVEESETKTSAGLRSLALDPTTVQALSGYIDTWEVERHLLGQAPDLLFVWPDGRPLHPDTITGLFHKHCTAARLPPIRLHDVRHSYASAALMTGVPPKVISERLGHATAAFTLQTYAHVIPGMDEEAANAVADLILGDQHMTGAVRNSVRTGALEAADENWPGTKSQASGGSGGRI